LAPIIHTLLFCAHTFPFPGFGLTGFAGFGFGVVFGVAFGGGDKEACDFEGDDLGFDFGAGFGVAAVSVCGVVGGLAACFGGALDFGFGVGLGGGDMSVMVISG
jgi:hypothetical protein